MNPYRHKMLITRWLRDMGTEYPIDYGARPVLKKGDEHATEYARNIGADIGNGRKEYVIPTVLGASIQNPDDAVDAFFAGLNPPLAEFNSPDEAERYARGRTNFIGQNRAVYDWGIKPLSGSGLRDAISQRGASLKNLLLK